MKIETGKFYKTRDGRKVGPMIREDWYDGEPWTAEGINRYYTDNGSRVIPTGEPDDLISEWPTLTSHQQRTAEMIKVMQAYVDGADIEGESNGIASRLNEPLWNWNNINYRIAPAATPDTIDWSHVAPEFKWMARDSNGNAAAYTEEPKFGGLNWVYGGGAFWYAQGPKVNLSHFASYRRGTCDWKDSLVKRPE